MQSCCIYMHELNINNYTIFSSADHGSKLLLRLSLWFLKKYPKNPEYWKILENNMYIYIFSLVPIINQNNGALKL